ncbi:MAG TPA: spore coat U domain-containing protein [Allosphingosinicella sp.]|jgi:spore coat protein U-like protein
MNRLVGLLACAAALSAAPAQAQSCTVSADPVLFDPYDSLSPLPANGAGAVELQCDAPADVTVELYRPSPGPRAMSNGVNVLEYELFRDPARTSVWGDGGAAPGVSASGTAIDLPVYGRIPARQNVPAGVYSDVVTILISF